MNTQDIEKENGIDGGSNEPNKHSLLSMQRATSQALLTFLAKRLGCNIEDIKQTLMQGHFVMFMLGDISNSKNSFKEIKEALISSGKEMGMEVWVQRKAIFDKMHTV